MLSELEQVSFLLVLDVGEGPQYACIVDQHIHATCVRLLDAFNGCLQAICNWFEGLRRN